MIVSSESASAEAALRNAAGLLATEAVMRALMLKLFNRSRNDTYRSPSEQLSDRLSHGIQCSRLTVSGISGLRAFLDTGACNTTEISHNPGI